MLPSKHAKVTKEDIATTRYSPDKATDAAKALLAPASDMDGFQLYASSSANARAEHKLEGEAVLLLNTSDNGRAILSEEVTKEAATAFVPSESLPLTVNSNQDTAQKVSSGEIKSHLPAFLSLKSEIQEAKLNNMKVFVAKAPLQSVLPSKHAEVTKEDVAIIRYSPDQSTDDAKAFLAAAFNMDCFQFSVSSSADAGAEHKLEGEVVELLKTSDDGRAVLSDGVTEEAATAFVPSEPLPLTVNSNQDTAQKVPSGEIKSHLLAFLSLKSEIHEA